MTTNGEKSSILDARKVLFGINLKRFREKRGMNQEELAKAARITKGMVSMIESGDRSPSLENLYNLATALNIPPTDLLCHHELSIAEVELTLAFMEIRDKGPDHPGYKALENFFRALTEK